MPRGTGGRATGAALFVAAGLVLAIMTGATAAEEPGTVFTVVARPGATEVLDLRACVDSALAHNETLQAERLRRRELDGKRFQALSTGLPTIDLTGEWTRGRDPSFALDETFGGGGDGLGSAYLDSLFGDFEFLPAPEAIPAQTFWRTSANLHWDINPLKVIGAVGAANLGVKQQDLAILAAEHLTCEQTVAAYHEIILAAERLAAVEAEIANQQEFLTIQKMRLELGLATRLDTLQASVALANTRPRLRRARQGLGNSGARLNALMGRPPEDPLTIGNHQEIENDPIDRDLAVELALRRPDLEKVGVMTDLLRRNRSAQKADMRPYLTVDGAYGFVGRRPGELDHTGHDFWRASVAVTVPLFDGLLTKGLVRETEASIRRTEAELSGLKRQARVEVLELLTNLDAARVNLQAASLNLDRSEEVLQEMKLQLRLGKCDYLAVLEAEANRSLARSNLIEARFEVLTLTASLKRAIGYSPMVPLAEIVGLVPGGTGGEK